MQNINKLITNSANSVGIMKKVPFQYNRLNSPKWFDDECKTLKTKCIKYLHVMRKNRTTESIKNYVSARDNYKKIRVNKKREYYDTIKNKIIQSKHDPVSFWVALNTFRECKYLTKTNTISKDEWLAHYKEVFESQEEVQSVVQENSTQLNENQDILDATNEQLMKLVTYEELNYLIKKLSTGKSPGSDGIPNEVWKAVRKDVCQDNSFHEDLDLAIHCIIVATR